MASVRKLKIIAAAKLVIPGVGLAFKATFFPYKMPHFSLSMDLSFNAKVKSSISKALLKFLAKAYRTFALRKFIYHINS